MEELSNDEALAFFARLFPAGLRDPALLAELCPDGWSASPLHHALHPTAEQRYAEHVRLAERMRGFRSKLAPAEIEEPTPSFEQFIRDEEADQLAKPATPAPPTTDEDEFADLLGQCLWDVFSDNHDVIAADGRIVSLGSFRGSGGFLADFLEYGPTPPPPDDPDDLWSSWDRSDYLRFYMGTAFISGRADLTPVYALIFRRLQIPRSRLAIRLPPHPHRRFR